MIKKAGFIAAVMVVLLSGSWVQAGVSIIMNGSFEDNGHEVPDITTEAPRRWCDVNFPSDEFGGEVKTGWSTHGYGDGDGNSLTLYSKSLGTFYAGDMAMVSQQVYLADANRIIFDLKLSSSASISPWDPNLRTAVVLIDGNVIWDSNDLELNQDGEYVGQIEGDVNGISDANLHKLSLGIRANVDEEFPTYLSPRYNARWDFVKFNTHCGGFGYLPEDLNRDCYVNFVDFVTLANRWLEQNPASKYDLSEDGVVDEYDVMVFAEGWLDCTDWQDNNCYEAELLAADLDDNGVVDLRDFAILAGGWSCEEDCIKGDIVRDGVVDYDDIFELSEQWLQQSWLYGLE